MPDPSSPPPPAASRVGNTSPPADAVGPARLLPLRTLLPLLSVALAVATGCVLCIFHQSWGELSVGSISSPAGLREMGARVDPAASLQQILRDHRLLDSVERLGPPAAPFSPLNPSQ